MAASVATSMTASHATVASTSLASTAGSKTSTAAVAASKTASELKGMIKLACSSLLIAMSTITDSLLLHTKDSYICSPLLP